MVKNTHNKRMQPDFGELALASAADARRYVVYKNPSGEQFILKIKCGLKTH
jgi:hypothetical protein